jgi:hypothetical protein
MGGSEPCGARTNDENRLSHGLLAIGM